MYKVSVYSCLDNSISLFNGLISINLYNQTFNLFVVLLTFMILSITSFYIAITPNPVTSPARLDMIHRYERVISLLRKHFMEAHFITGIQGNFYKVPEYTLLLLFVITGAIFLMLSNDLIVLFLAIELQSYGLYLISTIFKNSENSTKAGLTYFLLGGFSSCIILLGLSLLYINFGVTNLESIYIIYDLFNIPISEHLFYISSNDYIHVTLVILTIGLLFKISAAPFHFWSPDVYDNIPTVVTTFVAVIGKISILIIMLQLCISFNNSYTNSSWINNILISSVLSLIIGTVLGLSQPRIKRLFAYSTISHIGFILLGLAISTTESIQAFVFYLIQYSITNLNVFLLLVYIGWYLRNYEDLNWRLTTGSLKDRINSPIQLTLQLRGLSKINPMLALTLAITILSFLGIPPLAGFFGKLMILSASLDSGYITMSLLIIVTSVIAGVYYLMIIKEMYFYETRYFFSAFLKMYFDEFKERNLLVPGFKRLKLLIYLESPLPLIISIITILITVYIIIPEVPLNALNIITVSMNIIN